MELGFWSLARRHPDKVVIHTTRGEEATAGEVLARSNQLVHGLRRRGLERGAVVAVAATNRREVLELYLAAMQAGWYFLVLDPELRGPTLQAILDDARPAALFRDGLPIDPYAPPDPRTNAAQSLLSEGPAGEAKLACYHFDGPSWPELWQEESADAPDGRTAGERLLYTSGTTGRPKAIRRPLSGLSPEYLGKQAALHLKAVCDISPNSGLVHLVASSLCHSASQIWCCDHLQVGHRVVLMPSSPWDGEIALEAIARFGVTGSLMVPTHFRRLLALPEPTRAASDVSSLRHVVHTGAPCPVSLKKAMLSWWGGVLYEVYGAAEGPGTRVSPSEWMARPGTVGRGHGRVRILDDKDQDCPPGEIGHVHLRLGRRAASQGGFSSVGDMGYLDMDDYLYLIGRSDGVLITGGINVYPEEVEAVLAAHPAVSDVAVVGRPDPEWGQRVEALVQPLSQPTPPGLARELREFARQRLPAAKCPKAIHFVFSLPRDQNGKLRRAQLLSLEPER